MATTVATPSRATIAAKTLVMPRPPMRRIQAATAFPCVTGQAADAKRPSVSPLSADGKRQHTGQAARQALHEGRGPALLEAPARGARPHRLQERRPAAALRDRARQDPLAPRDRPQPSRPDQD